MMSRRRQNLSVFVDTAQHGMVTRSQARNQLQKGKPSAVAQPLQSVQNRQKGRNSVGGKRKIRAAGKKLGEDTSSKRRVSRSLATRENNENASQQANVAPNSRAANVAGATSNKPAHTLLRRSSRRDSVVSMTDEAPDGGSWADDQACPMSTVKAAAHSPEPAPAPKPLCDIEHSHDDLYFVPYVEEIYAYLRERELSFRPSPTYMDHQGDINPRMRSILVNWLIEVHEKFRLRSSTLYLTVSIVDRFLSTCQVTRSKLQLVGCVAMLLASKFEEIYPPEVQDFVYIADSAYTRDEILEMESNVIRALGWETSVVTPHSFANRFLQLAGATEWEQIYTYYLLELALVEYRMLAYKASELAAAAVHLTLKLSPQRTNQTAEERWGEYHETHTKYSRADLKECMRELLDVTMNRNPKEKAVRKKYAKPDRQSVSEISVRKLMRSSFAAPSSQQQQEQGQQQN